MKRLNFGTKRKASPVGEPVKPYERFFLESPLLSIIDTPELVIRGWVIPSIDRKIVAARIKNAQNMHDMKFGLQREDVRKAYAHLPEDRTLFSGFEVKLDTFVDGEIEIQFDFGEGFVSIEAIRVRYSPEKLYESYFNEHLSVNQAEHDVLLQNKKVYYYEAERHGEFKRHANDPRLVALYLPQFHPIPENDKAWGKGFTEWSNVTAGKPRFVGHQQPLLPTDLGFYDLRLKENLTKQVELAQKYGIYGFCFYYYWFSGKQLLEEPLNIFLNNKKLAMHFMICWANENWTKRWDGRDQDVIIEQKYLDSDPLEFIKSVELILLDKRYINVDGKPILAVYRGSELREPKRYVDVWRKYFRSKHNLELEIVSMMNFDASDPRLSGFDAGIEFAPLTDYRNPNFNKKLASVPNVKEKKLDKSFVGQAIDYRALANVTRENGRYPFPTYRSIAPSWDNESRKKGRGSLTLFGSNPDLYAKWLDSTIAGQNDNMRPIFINAWNEWAEGAMLEPSAHVGHANLLRGAEVLSKHSHNPNNSKIFPMFNIKKRNDLAVIVHVYYREEWATIAKAINKIGVGNDIFVSVTHKEEDFVATILKDFPSATITLVPNRGRDVLPFVFLAQRIQQLGYEYILKLHTKRSTHRQDGQAWFKEIVDQLVPNRVFTKQIIDEMRHGVAMIGPSGHSIPVQKYIGGNKKHITQLLRKIYSRDDVHDLLNTEELFFGGTMFWCRVDALTSILDAHLIPEDFDSEKGQIDGTLAHALERLFTMIPQIEKKKILETNGKDFDVPKWDDDEYKYVQKDAVR